MSRRRAAPTVKRVSQELGGKSPNIILDDADLRRPWPAASRTASTIPGQSCNAPTRMLVPQAKMKEVAAIAKAVAEKAKAGDPRGAEHDYRSRRDAIQWDKIQGLIKKGIDEGATLVDGGPGRPEGSTRASMSRPTVFADVTNDMTIAREEIFGPVLSIMRLQGRRRRGQHRQRHALWPRRLRLGGNVERARKVGARNCAPATSTSTACPTSATAPFGGYKQSGNGREWGKFGLEEYPRGQGYRGLQCA